VPQKSGIFNVPVQTIRNSAEGLRCLLPMFMIVSIHCNERKTMAGIERAIEVVRELVPDLDGRISQFEVETFEMDAELIEAFCEELERVGGDLKSGLDDEDLDRARVAAHSIKGMGGTMGLPEISVLAQEIELTIRADDLSRAKLLGDALFNWSKTFIESNQ
jgi:HPt (histidine-containing phosphotransfer) domain-containing protein